MPYFTEPLIFFVQFRYAFIGMGSFLLHYNKNTHKHILQFSYPGLKKFDNFSFEKERNKQNKKDLKVFTEMMMKDKK